MSDQEGKKEVLLRSPNEMFKAAKENMLDGKAPVSHGDWAKVFNFFAANIIPAAAAPACKVMRILFKAPLSEADVAAIARFQAYRANR